MDGEHGHVRAGIGQQRNRQQGHQQGGLDQVFDRRRRVIQICLPAEHIRHHKEHSLRGDTADGVADREIREALIGSSH